MKWILLMGLVFSYWAGSNIKKPVNKDSSIKPQYENCKGKDIYKLNSEFQDKASLKETEASGPCMECFTATHSETDSLDEIAETIEETKLGTQTKMKGRVRVVTNRGNKSERDGREIKNSPYKAFKDQLRRRVLGQVKTKIARTQILQKCTKAGNIEDHRQWFAKRFPKVDWPLMKALCEKKKKDFHSSIENRWSDMRVSRVLSRVLPYQQLNTRPANLSFPISHEVSDFGSMPKLTKAEQQRAKEKLGEHLSKVPLDHISSDQIKLHLKEERPLRRANAKDLYQIRKASEELREESLDRYRKHLDEMPLLGYMKTGDPENKEDMDEAFSKYMGHLDDLLEKVEDKDVDMALLLKFEPLVEGLLKDNETYCLVAAGARLQAEREGSLKKWGIVAAGVVAAVPCFMTAGLVCLGLGVAVGALGYKEASEVSKETLERYLTGKEFETMASLAEKDREAFWELALLPTAAWGTTAGAAQTIKQLFKGAALQSKKSVSAGDDITRIENAKAIQVTKESINPDDIHIEKIRPNAVTSQTDIFQVKFISSNGSEVKFNLEIPSELLEKKRLETEKIIQDLLEVGELEMEEVDRVRKNW
ncbi:MAG: hypothetical protein OXH36_02630, partial [Bdellovibrionales bacterium]|nr:hypothetical protein [Bdellovibrionales bacterium]